MNDEQRQALRESLRQARRELTAEQQMDAARGLLDLIIQQDFYKNASQVAFYMKVDGEIDPQLLMDHALNEGKACLLPVVTKDNPEQVSFAPYSNDTTLNENQWGIGEPPPPESVVAPTNFDVVFVPLVGFDANCFRLGMGKGFYDRTFSFKIFNRRSQPLLVGLAHECQLTDAFPTESWDVRLDAVATAKKIYRPDTA